jgi:precorrin-8X/cobalt-precorrin-8 methylmutase
MFQIREPEVNNPNEIEAKSLEIIESEALSFKRFEELSFTQKEVVKRLIHTTSCFDEVLNNIYFSDDSVHKIANLLKRGAKIVVDTNMIKSGLSNIYLEKFQNEVICYVNEPRVFSLAKEQNVTRSYMAIKLAILENTQSPLILACGNAPTFIYSAIKTLIESGIDLSNVALLLFPVGFVNVVESKEYGKEFSKAFDVPAIIMDGRFGSSTMIVSTLHSIYKLILNKNL